MPRLARSASEAGFDSLWTMDHFFQIRASGEHSEAPMLEADATSAFVAGQTRRIRPGTLNLLPGALMLIGRSWVAGAPWVGVAQRSSARMRLPGSRTRSSASTSA